MGPTDVPGPLAASTSPGCCRGAACRLDRAGQRAAPRGAAAASSLERVAGCPQTGGAPGHLPLAAEPRAGPHGPDHTGCLSQCPASCFLGGAPRRCPPCRNSQGKGNRCRSILCSERQPEQGLSRAEVTSVGHWSGVAVIDGQGTKPTTLPLGRPCAAAAAAGPEEMPAGVYRAVFPLTAP